MRFCVMDMNTMVFKYADSPKESFTILDMEDLVSCNFEDPKRTKPLKIKNQKERQSDLRYLLYLIGRKRTYVLSANTRADQVMWFNGFQVFFKVKHVINLVKNGAAFSKQSLQMLEEARARDALRSRDSSLGKIGTFVPRKTSKKNKTNPAMAKPVNATQIGLKGSLDKQEKATPKGKNVSRNNEQLAERKVFYSGQSFKKEKRVLLSDNQVVKMKSEGGLNKSYVVPSISADSESN